MTKKILIEFEVEDDTNQNDFEECIIDVMDDRNETELNKCKYTKIIDTPSYNDLKEFTDIALHELIHEKKIDVINEIKKGLVFEKTIADNTKMSPPLVSYHINGNRKGLGLVEYMLVEKVQNKKQTVIGLKLTNFGIYAQKILNQKLEV